MDNLLDPPRDLTVMPFWFWNDDLDEKELIRQIDDFEQHGVYGFVIHPRLGLPKKLAWMSEELLRFYRIAIIEAHKRNMRVSLYDEGMYPSGSSAGQVVAENSTYACRCLAKIDLPSSAPPALKPGEHLVAVVQRCTGEYIAVIDKPAAAYIRGLHYLGDGPNEERPPAADLLNPEAVATFIRLVYDKFYQAFADYFGTTIVSIFTDEPSLLAKCLDKNVYPGTTGILKQVSRILGYDFTPCLPALWFDDEADAKQLRQAYLSAVNLRLKKTYYAQLAAWCKQHNMALTGHPKQPDDIGILRHFRIPGQDSVWRRVLPDHPSALEGSESTQAKCTSSVMLHTGRQRNANECYGAYGHELTFEEMLWLAHWLFIRGVNLLYPHAFYYSVRGERKNERPPDVGPNSTWWSRYSEYALACRRFAWLNTKSKVNCSIAILGKEDYLPWQAAKACFQHQYDFNYLTGSDILEHTSVDKEQLTIHGCQYRVLITEFEPEANVLAKLMPFADAGRLIYYQQSMVEDELLAALDALGINKPHVFPPTKALRVRHVYKNHKDYYLLFNEEKAPVTFRLGNLVPGKYCLFNPYSAETSAFDTHTSITLASYETVILIAEPDFSALPFSRTTHEMTKLSVDHNRLLVFSACDSVYLNQALPLIRSLDIFSPGFQFLLHIVNPNDEDINRIQQLKLSLSATELTVSYERVDLSNLDLDAQKTYYACVRFLRLAELKTQLQGPVLCLDADSLIVNPIDLNFSNKSQAEFCLVRRDQDGPVIDYLAVANGTIWFLPRPGVHQLLESIAHRIAEQFRNQQTTWGLDQVVVGQKIRAPEFAKLGIFNINKKYADWEFNDDSIVWAGKGKRKYTDLNFFLLQNLINDQLSKQFQAYELCKKLLNLEYKLSAKIQSILDKRFKLTVSFHDKHQQLEPKFAQTDIERWVQNSRQHPSWDDRNKLIASFILPGESIIDVGAGAKTLAHYLSPDCEYTPLDVVDSGGATIYANFNAFFVPCLKQVFDVAVCSGVLEYVVPVDFFFASVASWANTIILSYATSDLNPHDLGRQRSGWLNHYSDGELQAFFSRHGLTVKTKRQWQQQMVYVLDSCQANKSFYYQAELHTHSSDIASIFRYDKTNVGDFYCLPSRYFNTRSYRCIDISQIDEASWLPQHLIIGGGGLLGSPTFNPYFDKLFAKNYRLVIGWGLGDNQYVDRVKKYVEPTELAYPEYINRFDLLGVRDIGTDFHWVPCASCMHPLFDEHWPIINDIVIFEHKRIPINISGFPKMNNDTDDIASVIRFIGTARVVITNSYHAAYWAQLMGKAVLAFPFSSKFYHFKHKLTLGKQEDWKKLLDQVEEQSPALQECRDANIKFYGLVKSLLDTL